jgi:hypothetical protein
MEGRERRLAENESFFRAINERLEEQAPDSAPSLIVICECANADCAQRIPITHAEYEAVRRESVQFLVAPGHAEPDIEEVVRQAEAYEVVRKRGLAGEVAEDLDDASSN